MAGIALTLSGILVGVACSEDIRAVAADAVATAVAAIDVTYDPTWSATEATNVQAALDALDVRVDAAPDAARVEAIEATSGDTRARIEALEAAGGAAERAALEARVAALEAAGGALEARTATVEADTAALEASVQALEAADEALQAALDAVGTCGEGFFDVGPSCMETTPRPTVNWNNARSTCMAADLRLCGIAEYLWGCGTGSFDTTAAPEWTGTVLGPDQVLVSKMKNPCVIQEAVVEPTNTSALAFRCCRTK